MHAENLYFDYFYDYNYYNNQEPAPPVTFSGSDLNHSAMTPSNFVAHAPQNQVIDSLRE